MSISIKKFFLILFLALTLVVPLIALDNIDKRISIAENSAVPDSTLENLYFEGYHQFRFNDPVRSNYYLLKLANFYDERGNYSEKYYRYSEIGATYHKLGMYHLALEYLIETGNYFLGVNDEVRVGWVYSDIGNVYFAINEYDLAKPYYIDALEMMMRNDNDYGKAVMLNNIALCQIKQGEIEEAFVNFDRALKFREKHELSYYLVYHSKALIAENHALVGNSEQASELFKEIWSQEVKDNEFYKEMINIKASAGLALFDYYLQIGEIEKAEHFMEASIELSEDMDDYHALGIAQSKKAEYLAENNRNEEALAILEEIFDYALEHEFFTNAYIYADRLIKLNLKQNRLEDVAFYYDHYLNLTETLLSNRETKNLVQLHTTLQNYLKEVENAKLKELHKNTVISLIVSSLLFAIIVLLIFIILINDKKSIDKIKNLADASSEGIVIHDRGEVIAFNNQIKKLVEEKKSERKSKNLADYVIAEDREEFKQILHSNEKDQLETKLITSSGNFVDVIITSRPFKYRRKEVKVAVFHDVTILNQKINSLVETQQQLKVLNGTKDRLLSIIGHDLKNSFNAITGFSEIMKDSWRDTDPEEIDEMLQMINQTSLAANALLDNLLKWARMQTAGIKINPKSFAVCDSVNETIEVLTSSIKIKKINMEVDCNRDILLYADYSMVTTVIRNLLTNAIKFTHNGGDIKVTVSEDSHFTIISVEDSGVGMSQEDITNLFEVGKIPRKYGTNREEGTGLGLLLCKEIVEAHQGNVTIESELNKGSKFTIMFPKDGN